MIRNIVFFSGLNIVINIIVGSIYSIMNFAIYETKSLESIQESMMKNIYIITAISAAITFFIYLLVLKNKNENLWQRCNFKKITPSYIYYSILIAISISVFTCPIISLISEKFESYNQVADSIYAAYGSILSMVCIIILMPIFEEILFRGLIFNELKKNTNIILAVILQSLIFALFHGNMLQGIYTFILGIILCILYLKTGSLWSNILCHIIYNLFGSLLMPLALSYTKNYTFVYIGAGLIATAILLISMLKKETNSINSYNLNS
ncbi:lysostaphin resistance A-like protein [Clostridium botulinum]